MEEPIIEIKGLTKRFGETVVLDGVNLTINRGEVVVIIGPSGSGKTTLLRCVNFLETYEAGTIKLDGEEIGYRSGIDGRRRKRSERELARFRADLGMVFQSFNLFPHLTAMGNVMLGLRKVRKMSKNEARKVATHWLSRVGLADKLNSLPAQLSGGQQQRVGIARSMAATPKVLLLDEITSALDPELVGEVLEVVSDLVDEGRTMLVVTHEMMFARDIASRIIFMDEAKIVCEGSPEDIIIRPQHERLKAYLSRFLTETKATNAIT
jgi:polar amino acid transport system ATP-binding protein